MEIVENPTGTLNENLGVRSNIHPQHLFTLGEDRSPPPPPTGSIVFENPTTHTGILVLQKSALYLEVCV